MALILNIETSTNVCSASLANNGEVIALKEDFEGKSHASLLTVFISELFSENNIDIINLEAVSVSEGPGSYTGLRIGVSTAKGICFAKSIPLIATNTLQAMAIMASENISNDISLFCPMIDARRMEVYSALFDKNQNQIRETKAEIIDESSYSNELANSKIAFFGDGADKCKSVINNKNAVFIDNIYPSAKFMARLSEEAFMNREFKDVAYFEPFYLKDFIATVSKKKIF
jgi:tRNA threonylcarbamoyladenosine biosynthesis protein TsaB